MPRRVNPDRILVAKLTGTAGRHASRGTATDEAIAELKALAGGRADLLAQVAGTALGAAETSPHPPWCRREAELCILAGADESLVPAIAAEVKAHLRRPLHTTHD